MKLELDEAAMSEGKSGKIIFLKGCRRGKALFQLFQLIQLIS